MFSRIELDNFKSIRSAKAQLRPLTVVVGANGSGKSNLIKSLGFISSVVERGLPEACMIYGGWSGITPKNIPQREVNKKKIRIAYTCELPPPDNYPSNFPPLQVDHEMVLVRAPTDGMRIESECLTFHELFNVVDSFLSYDMGNESADEYNREPKEPSSFSICRGPQGGYKYEFKPSVRSSNLALYIEWLGFGFAKDSIKNQTQLKVYLKKLATVKRSGIPISDRARSKFHSLIDTQLNTSVDFSPNFGVFRSHLNEIRRYDLQLTHLRNEQKSGRESLLTTSGDNMPTVLRRIKAAPNAAAAWERIQTTFGIVAPHIRDFGTKSMGGGREFVEFVEAEMGRGIESWESSDGSLRALAILLAVETHPKYGTMLIEEPEQNLHPWAIRGLMEHIREAISRRNLQVIITTHSQQVLEQVEPDEVLVAENTVADGTKYSTLNHLPGFSELSMGDIGELWVQGLLGGVPSHD